MNSKYLKYAPETQNMRDKNQIGPSADQFPLELIRSFALFKKAHAAIHDRFEVYKDISSIISRVCNEILDGHFDDHFPLSSLQTTSGNQLDMNINEVISNRAIELLGGNIGSKTPVHPNQHVNLNQNPNFTFLIVMHLSIVRQLILLYETLKELQDVLRKKYADIIVVNPFIINQISVDIENLQAIQMKFSSIGIDEGSVQVQIWSGEQYGQLVAQYLSRFTKSTFIYEPIKFNDLNTYNSMVELSNFLCTLATSLTRFIDITIKDANEVKTTQESAAITVKQLQINHMAILTSISLPGIHLIKPLMIKNILHSIKLANDIYKSYMNFIHFFQ